MAKKSQRVVGVTFGAFDLCHAGHLLMLEESRKQCDALVVGLHIDPSFERADKNPPVETMRERTIRLNACKFVDIIVPYKTEDDLIKILKKLKPQVRFIGEDWKGKNFTGKDLKIPIVWNSRTHNYSSSNLRKRIEKAISFDSSERT